MEDVIETVIELKAAVAFAVVEESKLYHGLGLGSDPKDNVEGTLRTLRTIDGRLLLVNYVVVETVLNARG